jgi:DNA repair exonuclease SbcCD nuclease subunit
MKLPALLTTDLHLAAGESASYRFGLFPWLAETIREERVKTLVLLGDLTDAKDNHPAELVNKIVMALNSLPVERIVIIAGNHDWLKAGNEFFKFLNLLSNVEFITKPTEDEELSGASAYFLPYSKNPAKDWEGMDFSHYTYLFMHQTVSGSIASNGQKMQGEPLPPLNASKVYSGDIHVPQVIGDVEYVGSPYHVHLGDSFKPRCVLLERNGNPVDLHFQTISRRTVKVESLAELRKLRFKAGDHVKLRIELSDADKHQWAAIKREASAMMKDSKVVLQGVELVVAKSELRVLFVEHSLGYKVLSPSEYVYKFVDREGLPADVFDIAMEILEP